LGALGRSQDPRGAGARILDTAEGVLIALRGCSVNQAFVEIVRTAKAHNVSTLSLADALVALAQDQAPQDGEAPHWSPPVLRGGTLSAGSGRAAACDWVATTTVLPALRTGWCRCRGRRRATAR
jgi:hypothetical protein